MFWLLPFFPLESRFYVLAPTFFPLGSRFCVLAPTLFSFRVQILCSGSCFSLWCLNLMYLAPNVSSWHHILCMWLLPYDHDVLFGSYILVIMSRFCVWPLPFGHGIQILCLPFHHGIRFYVWPLFFIMESGFMCLAPTFRS